MDIQPAAGGGGDRCSMPARSGMAAQYPIPMLGGYAQTTVPTTNDLGATDTAWTKLARLPKRDQGPHRNGPDGRKTDFATLARSMGVYGEGRIDNPKDVRPASSARSRRSRKKGRLELVDTIHAAPVLSRGVGKGAQRPCPPSGAENGDQQVAIAARCGAKFVVGFWMPTTRVGTALRAFAHLTFPGRTTVSLAPDRFDDVHVVFTGIMKGGETT